MQEGETSHHYVTISNTSEALLFNNVFKDTMSAGASYVPGSAIVNGVAQPSYDPIAGFHYQISNQPKLQKLSM